MASIKPPRANKRRRSLVSGIPPPQITHTSAATKPVPQPSTPAAKEREPTSGSGHKCAAGVETKTQESLPLPPPPPLPAPLQELTNASEPAFWKARQAVAQSALRELQTLESQLLLLSG
ncbi:hypothetical protein PINS_up012639 [Pythium insidiosum]|nr:hypothetical protein PINS_up012639 [Pythium insidiosum]